MILKEILGEIKTLKLFKTILKNNQCDILRKLVSFYHLQTDVSVAKEKPGTH